jgi:hypothetical protein
LIGMCNSWNVKRRLSVFVLQFIIGPSHPRVLVLFSVSS